MTRMDNRDWEEALLLAFKHNSDFIARTVNLFNDNVKVYYIQTLVELPPLLATLHQMAAGPEEDGTALGRVLLPFEHDANQPAELLVDAMLQGKLVVCRECSGKPVILDPGQLQNSRSVTSPQNENPLQSSFGAFTEDLNKNIGLLRKHLKMKDLTVETDYLGTNSLRRLALLYVEGKANRKVVRQIKERLHRNKGNDVYSLTDLLGVLEQPKYVLVPTYLSTETPENAVQNLLDGKVVLFLDQHPFALIFPALVKDLWSIKSDSNYPRLYALFFCYIRLAGILFAIVMPGLYVVLNSVNPELLRIQLAISVSKSREGVPYPSLVEVLIMLLLLEMVIEATIRLPKSVGPTITMIGGIILGQAIVQAKLVSNLLIIILAASTIANYTMTGYLNTIGIRIYRYVVLIVSAVFGIYGLEAAIIGLCIYFADLRTFSVPYLRLSAKGMPEDE
ncbi:spore germination protein [Paenibacillus hodogayensis]|uniref:Spore germination protein n=1 Tax=Paenibacillus hodogayensis TaxID=279208 RepID=A0ABV5W6R3_9BACL